MKNGPYELILAPKGYPGKKYRERYAYEHIIAWWRAHGTCPAKGYEIHHVDGDHRNNKIDNLRLMTSAEHARIHSLKKSEEAEIFVICFGCKGVYKLLKSKLKTRLKQSRSGRLYCGRSCQARVQMKERWQSSQLTASYKF